MTAIDTTRFCAYHGGFVKLARCPIVATSERFNEDARMQRGRRPAQAAPRPAVSVDFDEMIGVEGAPAAEPEPTPWAEEEEVVRNVPGALGPQRGGLLRSKVDGLERVVLAQAPGIPAPPAVVETRRRSLRRSEPPPPVPELPTVVDLAGGRDGLRGRPARACPDCWHPFPVTIDQRNPYPVALIGHAEASKTTTILALIDGVTQHGAEVLGVRSFAATQQTMHALALDDKEIFSNFRKGIGPQGNASRHHAPLEFLTYLPNGDVEVALLIQDAAGEDLMDEETRTYRTFLWADVVIFLYNPEDSPAHGSERFDQAVLLNAVKSDIEAYGQQDASGAAFSEPKLIIAVSKADLLDPPPDLRSGPAPEEDVKAAIVGLRDAAMLGAAQRWKSVHWCFIAPLPEHGGEPQGVTDLFALLLTLL